MNGPVQLLVKPLTVSILDTDFPLIKTSLDIAEARLLAAGATAN